MGTPPSFPLLYTKGNVFRGFLIDFLDFLLSAPPPLPTPYFFTYHVFYFLFHFYTICLSLGNSDDVDMTDHPPPHTTSAAPETKQFWRRWRSHIPLSPVEQPRVPLSFYLFIFFLIYCID